MERGVDGGRLLRGRDRGRDRIRVRLGVRRQKEETSMQEKPNPKPGETGIPGQMKKRPENPPQQGG